MEVIAQCVFVVEVIAHGVSVGRSYDAVCVCVLRL